MSKTTKKTSTKMSEKRIRFQDWKNTKWVLNNIDDDLLAQIDNADFDTGRYMDWLSHLVDHGIEVKFTFDDWSQCYQATALGAWQGFPNCGYAVAARSDEGFEDCIKILWGKIEFIAQMDLVACYEQPQKRSRRG